MIMAPGVRQIVATKTLLTSKADIASARPPAFRPSAPGREGRSRRGRSGNGRGRSRKSTERGSRTEHPVEKERRCYGNVKPCRT